jgi:hypothetical protein
MRTTPMVDESPRASDASRLEFMSGDDYVDARYSEGDRIGN